ncbi:MAG: lipid II flippase MurJ, partial [Alphaproteobacteria bacterium]
GDQAAAADSQNRAIEMALLLTLPATAALLTIPGPMIAVLFERGAFAAADSRATTLAVMAYATGLPAFVVVKALAPGFFAREDTATPVKVAVAAMAANLLLALALMAPLGHVGIALATSLASWLNVALLGGLLMRRGHWRPDGRLLRRTVRMIVASAVMSVGLVLAAAALDGWLAAPAGVRPVLALALLVGLGGGLFAGLALACRATSLQELRRQLARPAKPATPATEDTPP